MFVFGIFTVLSSLGVVFSRKPLTSALYLVVTLFLVAVHFALLGAHFIAVIQIMVYAGAIMVLVIFVIMLLGAEPEGTKQRYGISTLFSVVVLGFFLYTVLSSVRSGFKLEVAEFIKPQTELLTLGNTEAVGRLLYTKYLFPFELASLLLLAAIIGAVVLALDAKKALPPGRGLRAKQSKQEPGK